MSGTASRFVLPYQTVIDGAGIPIPGAKLFFYESGTDTPLDTFSNAGLTIPNRNPVEANGAGMFGNIFMLSQPYKVVLTDALEDEIWTADPVVAVGPGGSQASLRSVSANTVVLSTDNIIEVDASGGLVTITYPMGLGNPTLTQEVTIVKTDSTDNPVAIRDDGSATIRAALSRGAQGANMQSAVVYSNGIGLRILNG